MARNSILARSLLNVEAGMQRSEFMQYESTNTKLVAYLLKPDTRHLKPIKKNHGTSNKTDSNDDRPPPAGIQISGI